MLKSIRYTTVVIATVLSVSTTIVAISQNAQAQSLQNMSCEDLWYARNQIFADKGYCFKTRRGRAAFGRNCFPPYGRLSSGEQRRVDRIRREERRYCR